jgi:Tol biopolymer transport system component
VKPQEGYSPDSNYLVLGEVACNPNSKCDLYIGEPSVVVTRSQGQWTSGNERWLRADNPAWSPTGNLIAFLWNRDNDRTKNVFIGTPFQTDPAFQRLTDFGGRRDSKDLSWSPDASQIAFATQDGPRWQIWVLDANAGPCIKRGEDTNCPSNPRNISNSASDDWDPLWIK